MIQYTSEYGGRIGWGLSGKTTGEVKPFFCRTGTTKLNYYKANHRPKVDKPATSGQQRLGPPNNNKKKNQKV